MTRGSEAERGRPKKSPRDYCAISALLLCLLVAPAFGREQLLVPQNSLQNADNASSLSVPQGQTPEDDTPVVSGRGILSPQATATILTKAATESTNAHPTLSNSPQSSTSDDLDIALERPGDLNLHGLSLEAALFTISEQWNINIVFGQVEATVNGVFKGVPLKEILDAILLSNGYNYRQVGQSLVVSSVNDLGQTNPSFQSATIAVNSADIDEVVEIAQQLHTSPQGQVRAIKSARSIVVLDFPDKVDEIRQFVSTIDDSSRTDSRGMSAPLEVGYFRTQFISAESAEDALAAVMSSDGQVGILVKEDRLIVSDYAENLAMVEKVLKRIDRPRPQVRITALIYDISLQDLEELGFNWNQVGIGRTLDANGDPQSILSFDSIMKVPFQANSVGSALTFMNLTRNFDISAVVLALQNASDARLLANPNVSVLENDEAVFQSVSEIPYQQLTQTEAGGQIGTTSFKEAGITLRVRPKISSDGTIEMRVSPEFSRLTGFTPGDNQPVIDRRTATTTLRIADRQTVVIGGLRQRSDIGEFNAVPFLKDVRVLGKLFRARETDVRESELVVFIMPEIIGYADPPDHRQQLVADTIDYRLNQIAQAEGSPTSCGSVSIDSLLEPSPEIEMGPSLPTPTEARRIQIQPSLNADITPVTDDCLEVPEIEFNVAMSDPLSHAEPHRESIRRLPVVLETMATVETKNGPAEGGSLFAAPSHLETRLRPDYDTRFRATGGTSPEEQRVAERPSPPSQSNEVPTGSGLLNRLLKF